MANELKHTDVGSVLTEAEYDSITAHQFDSQATGDIMYASSSSQLSRLGIGSTGAILTVTGGVPAWDTTWTPTGDLIPSADDTYDLGSAAAAWQDLFLEGDITLTDAGTIATSAGALTVTSAAAATWSTSAGALTVNGTGGINLQEGGATIISISDARVLATSNTASVDLDATGAIQVNSSGGAISVANDNVDQTVNLATAGTRTLNIGIGDGTDITTTVIKGTVSVGVDDAGYDVTFFGDTASRYWLWDTSADGVVQRGTLTVGVDDTGHDVKFFGATASAYMLWDESEDDLILAGAAGLDVDGVTNLDNTDIDGTLVVDGTNISLDSTTTLNIDNSNTSNGITIGTATSGVPINIGHATSLVTIGDNLTVTGDLTVSGTTTTVTSTTVAIADSMLLLAKDQGTSADAVDFGLYGKYGAGGTAKYAGIFRDLSATNDPWTFFDELQAEPGTTVNTGGTGYALAAITAAEIVGTTIDASTDFTIGDTVITDGVITDTSGLSIAAAVDLGANTLTTTGSLQVRTIDYSDGDLAITIADGGLITAAAGITSLAQTNSFGASTFNNANISAIGDAQLDSITGAGDTNTNITFAGSDVITMATGGTERMRLTDNGIHTAVGKGFVIGHDARVATANGVNAVAQIHGGDGSASAFQIVRWEADVHASELHLSHSRGGTLGTANGALSNNDGIGVITFGADDGAGFHPSAYIKVEADADHASDEHAARITFETATGSASPTPRMRIDSAGDIFHYGGGTTATIQMHDTGGNNGSLSIIANENSNTADECRIDFNSPAAATANQEIAFNEGDAGGASGNKGYRLRHSPHNGYFEMYSSSGGGSGSGAGIWRVPDDQSTVDANTTWDVNVFDYVCDVCGESNAEPFTCHDKQAPWHDDVGLMVEATRSGQVSQMPRPILKRLERMGLIKIDDRELVNNEPQIFMSLTKMPWFLMAGMSQLYQRVKRLETV